MTNIQLTRTRSCFLGFLLLGTCLAAQACGFSAAGGDDAKNLKPSYDDCSIAFDALQQVNPTGYDRALLFNMEATTPPFDALETALSLEGKFEGCLTKYDDPEQPPGPIDYNGSIVFSECGLTGSSHDFVDYTNSPLEVEGMHCFGLSHGCPGSESRRWVCASW